MDIKKLAVFSAAFFLACAISYAAEAEKGKAPAEPKAGEGAMMPVSGDARGVHKMCHEGMMKPEEMEKNGKKHCKECEKNAKKGYASDCKKTQKEFDMRGNNQPGKKGFFPHFGNGFFGMSKKGMHPKCRLSDEEIFALIKDADSSFAKSIKSMKKDSKPQYQKAINSLKARLCFIKDKKSDKSKEVINKAVESVKAETEVSGLIFKYRKAAKENKPAIKNELKAALEKLFDIRIEEQKMRIQAMEEALAEQKKSVEDKKASKSRIVETRLDEMTGENFRW